MILVTGANGQLGRLIHQALAVRGAQAVGSSRSGANSTMLIDFDKPHSVSFIGVTTLVLVSAGEAEDDVVIARHQTAITAAEHDGVGHIVYTSLTGAGDHLAFALAHRWTERRLQRGIVPWTILRNGLYAELFGSLLEWVDGGISSAFGDGELAAVTRGDLAEAAALVASAPLPHAGQLYELVGPALSARQVAHRLDVELSTISLADRRTRLDKAGLRPFQPAMLMSIYSAVRTGFLSEPDETLTALLGHPLRNTLEAAARAAVPSNSSFGGQAQIVRSI